MVCYCFFFFNAMATTEFYTYGHTLSLHDALPIFIDDISKVEGVDAMFLGRGDLGLSLSNAVDPVPALADAVENVVHIAKANGKAVSAVVQSMKSDEAKWLIDLGVTAMMVAQDLAFMRQAASAALNDFNETMKGVGQTP